MGVTARCLNPVSYSGSCQHITEQYCGGDKPQQRHVNAQAGNVEVPLRESAGDEEGGAPHNQQHAERNQKRGDLQLSDEQAADQAD